MKELLKNKIYIWIYSNFNTEIICSIEEKKNASNMNKIRAKEYLLSRSLIRQSLSEILNIVPLEIPLTAPPGKPPKLKKGFGYISLSHTKGTILIGWNTEKIGVDIERKDRKINEKVIKKVFSQQEIYENNILNNHNFLLGWTSKEAAIKWEEKSIFWNLFNWLWIKKEKKIINLINGTELDLINIDFKLWIISIATKRDGSKPKQYCFKDKKFEN